MISDWTTPLRKLVPMWGHPPQFPWEKCSHVLGELLNGDVKLSLGSADWKEAPHLETGFGESPAVISLELAPLDTPCFLLLPKSDVAKLTQALIGDTGPGLQDDEISKSFFEFSMLKVLSELSDLKPFGDLTPLLSDQPFDVKRSYCQDLALKLGDQTLWLRLVLPEKFHGLFHKHFANRKIDLKAHPKAQDTHVQLALEAGHTSMNANAWKGIGIGDFVILDRSSYDAESKKGSFIVSCGGHALFQARLKEGEIKVLDYAYTFEDVTMDEKLEDEELLEEAPPTHTEHQDLISADHVPLQLTVEVGKISMPLSKVLELKPGNILDLHVRPEEGVSLTISGKTVAKGELITVGDVVGVKITDIG